MFNFGFAEIAVICLIGILVFGRQLPKVISGTTKTIKEFRKGFKESIDNDKNKEEK